MAKHHTTNDSGAKQKMLYPWISVAGIALITWVALYPSLKNDFTNWDDNIYVYENPLVVNDHIPFGDIFSLPVASNYHPLTILSLAINYQEGKLDAAVYHRENLLIHVFNVALVFFFIFILTRGNLLVASFVGLFFGIHPMHVESVAWISGRKDVLYVFFFLAGLIAYLRYRASRKWFWYGVTVLLFVLSCLSKAMAVVFPLVLLLVDYLLEVKPDKKLILEKAPFFFLSFVTGIAAYKIQSVEAITDMQFFTIFQRITFACYGALMYVAKLFVPSDLSAFYPYPILNKDAGLPFFFYLTPFITAGLGAGLYFFLKKERALIFGVLFYLVTVALVLQFVSVGSVIMADRYSYLSYVGLLFSAAFYLNRVWSDKRNGLRYPLALTVAAAAVLFSFQTYAQTQVWKNSETLWTDVISKAASGLTGQGDKAYVNRGRYYHSIGENNKALQDYTSAMKINPGYAFSYNNRGNIYREIGRVDSALTDYNMAIALEPDNYLFYANRGNVYRNSGQPDKALQDINRSISLNPRYWANYYNRGLYYFDIKKDEQAIADFSDGIALNIDFADLYLRRGMSLARIKKFKESLPDFSRAIQLDPSKANHWLYRLYAEQNLGMQEEAKADLEKVKQLLGSGEQN